MLKLQARNDVPMMFGVCDHAVKIIVVVLETAEFSLEETKIKRVAVASNDQLMWLLWMQFPSQDKAVCEEGQECMN